jgi:hypothetical protein
VQGPAARCDSIFPWGLEGGVAGAKAQLIPNPCRVHDAFPGIIQRQSLRLLSDRLIEETQNFGARHWLIVSHIVDPPVDSGHVIRAILDKVVTTLPVVESEPRLYFIELSFLHALPPAMLRFS